MSSRRRAGTNPPARIGLAVFDLDETLAATANGYSRALRVLSAYGVDPTRFISAHDRWWTLYKSGGCTIEELYRGRMADCGLKGIVAREANDRYVEASTLVGWKRGARSVLGELRSGGTKVVILTNGGSHSQRQKAARLGLEACVDAVLISEEIGAVKPSPSAFRAALAVAGESAANAVMVGDDLKVDIEGAIAAGFGRAVWVTAAPGTVADERVVKVRRIALVPSVLSP